MIQKRADLDETPENSESEIDSDDYLSEEENIDLLEFPGQKNTQLSSLLSRSTIRYLDVLIPEIDDFNIIGISLCSTLLKNEKLNQKKVN